LGVFACVFEILAYIFLFIGVVGKAGLDYASTQTDISWSGGSITALLVFGIIFTALAIGMSITSLIFGKQSISTFAEVKRQGGAKPIATLVLGIVGLVYAAITLLIALISLVVIIIVAAGL
jgi:hypothetical protein